MTLTATPDVYRRAHSTAVGTESVFSDTASAGEGPGTSADAMLCFAAWLPYRL